MGGFSLNPTEWVEASTLGFLDLSPDMPPAPDYTGAAEATAEGNLAMSREAVSANRPNQFTPWGSSEWSQDPNDPTRWTQNVTLTPEQQRLFNLNQQTSQQMGEMGLAGIQSASDLFSSRYQTPEQAGLPTYGENRNQVIDAMMARSNRALENEKQDTHASLIAAGIPPGSEAYEREMRRINEKSVDARQQAEIAAANMATQEYRAGMDRSQQIITNALLERQTPLNELNALRTGTQVQPPQFSAFTPQQTVAGPDYMGATMAQGQWDLAGWNAEQAQQNAILSGIFGMGAAAAGKA